MGSEYPPELTPEKTMRRVMYVASCAYRRIKRKRRPFWSYVSDLTGHGSGYSAQICTLYGYHSDTAEPINEEVSDAR